MRQTRHFEHWRTKKKNHKISFSEDSTRVHAPAIDSSCWQFSFLFGSKLRQLPFRKSQFIKIASLPKETLFISWSALFITIHLLKRMHRDIFYLVDHKLNGYGCRMEGTWHTKVTTDKLKLKCNQQPKKNTMKKIILFTR